MLEKIIHVNSSGEVFDFVSLGIYIKYNNLRDFEWAVTSSNNYITGFTKGIIKKNIPFEFNLDYEIASVIKNKFYEHFEKDIIANTPGYFEINGYRFYCYITKSKKSNYLLNKKILSVELEISTDNPSWSKEVIHTFDKNSNRMSNDEKRYQYKYAYTYGKTQGIETINNECIKPSDFKIIIYGAVSNPTISIAGNIYNVECEIEKSEYLVIESKSREIYLHSVVGKLTNMFNKRNKENYIFEKIPLGYNTISWSGTYGFDIIIYDERGEPKWT